MKNFLFLLVVLIIIIHLCYKLEFYDGTYSDIETDTSNTSQNTIEYDMDVEIIDSSENNVIMCSNIYDNTPDCEMSAEQYVNLESEMVVDSYDPNNLDDATNQSHLAVYNTSVQDEANLLNQLSEFTYNEESDIYEPLDRVSVHPDVSGSSANEESVNTNYTTYITDNENAKKNIENITDHEQSKYSSLNESNSLDGMTINDIYGDLKVFCASTQDETWNESIGVDEDQSTSRNRPESARDGDGGGEG
jgi:hypothetical protein